jgi:Ni,Fe-hydrogenase I cytochrome b subunit
MYNFTNITKIRKNIIEIFIIKTLWDRTYKENFTRIILFKKELDIRIGYHCFRFNTSFTLLVVIIFLELTKLLTLSS